MDEELFKLCKEVYEKTGWGDGSDMNKVNWHDYYDDWSIPRYTSDYLMQKLQEKYDIVLSNDERIWRVINKKSQILMEADTPLKALLLLTIELESL